MRLRQVGLDARVQHRAVADRGERIRQERMVVSPLRQHGECRRDEGDGGGESGEPRPPATPARACLRRRDGIRDREQLGLVGQEIDDLVVRVGASRSTHRGSTPRSVNSDRNDSKPRQNRILQAASETPIRSAISANGRPSSSFITTTCLWPSGSSRMDDPIRAPS
jgi:hypothetical protein